LISSRHWEAPDVPGSYNFSLILTITDQGGNVITETVTYIVKVEPPKVAVEFGVANQNDVCPNETIAPNCPVPYGPLNGQVVTVGAGDTLTTRFAWTNVGLGEWDLLNLVDQDGATLANSEFDQEPGQTLISSHHLIAPGASGNYNWSQTLTVTDKGGNVITETVTFIVVVDCSLSDLAAPTALCQNRTYTIIGDETRNINAGAIDDGSFDGCGALAGGGIDVSSFTCDDEGPNTVTLTVGDLVGNSASCTATVTINVATPVQEGISNDCLMDEVSVAQGQAWQDVELNGRLVAQVIIGGNSIDGVRVGVYKTAAATEISSSEVRLSKRIVLTMLKNGNPIQPNTDPVRVRLYYSAEEIADLLSASGGDLNEFVIVKTDNDDCGSGYRGRNASIMSTTVGGFGCNGEDFFYEFFTGTFSTFYLFSSPGSLPVELTTFDAKPLPKQRAQLDWKTSTESGNSHFVIERSTDGASFTQVGEVAGAGNAVTEQVYAFIDEAPSPGLNYYRLRQVDFDGTESLSEVRQVMIESTNQISVYPNPTADELRVKGFDGGFVRILDRWGRVVQQQELAAGQALDVRSLPSGAYVLQLPSGALQWVKR